MLDALIYYNNDNKRANVTFKRVYMDVDNVFMIHACITPARICSFFKYTMCVPWNKRTCIIENIAVTSICARILYSTAESLWGSAHDYPGIREIKNVFSLQHDFDLASVKDNIVEKNDFTTTFFSCRYAYFRAPT